MARKISRTIIDIDRQTGHSKEWWDAIHLMKKSGLLSLHIPKSLGGGGHDLMAVVLAEEEIAKVDGGFANIVSHEACSYLIFTNARDAALRDDCIKRMSEGELTCIAITEPTMGADLAKMQTEARREGDGWVINGHKRVASLAAAAGMYLVFAMTDRSKGTKGISAFLIHKGTPGLSIGEPDELMGTASCRPPMST